MRYLALIASSATLLCCGLPALLVFMGFGAVVASLVSTLPILVVLSQHKLAVFGGSALTILIAWMISTKSKTCLIEHRREDCRRLKKASRIVLVASTVFWAVGFSAAYLLPRLLS
jgi:hypothetical protein